MIMDAVYFLRLMSKSHTMLHQWEELRYSLRSLAANALQVDRVWILGGALEPAGLPSWLDRGAIQWHPGAKPLREVDAALVSRWEDVKHLNTWNQWRCMAELAATNWFGAQFVIMNDDFFVMKPSNPLVNEHRGPIKEFAAARRFGGLESTAVMMERTAAWVADQFGLDEPDQVAYETHGPLTVPAQGFADVMNLADTRGMRAGVARLAKRSLVGNALRLPAELARDGKVHGNDDAVPDQRYLSSSDAAFQHGTRVGQIGRVVRRAFPAPCRFEVA